jgi:hypothetical protein
MTTSSISIKSTFVMTSSGASLSNAPPLKPNSMNKSSSAISASFSLRSKACSKTASPKKKANRKLK